MARALLRLSAVTVLVASVAWSSGTGFRGAVDGPLSTAEASQQSPWSESDLWLAPADPVTPSELARGVELLDASQPADALPLLAKSLADPDLGPYARLYVGRAHLALHDYERASTAARQILSNPPGSALRESAHWLLGEALEGGALWPEAVKAWQALAALPPAASATAHLRLAQATEKASGAVSARSIYLHIYYQWPTTAEAEVASAALGTALPRTGPDTLARELGRASALYAARRFSDARDAFAAALPRSAASDRATIALRIAQSDVQLQRYARGLEALDAYMKSAQGDRRTEAAFSRLAALRGLKRADYPARVVDFVRDHAASPLAETALNDLATHYILANDDAAAAAIFTDMYARYPAGAYADRAAWRAGWWAYRSNNLPETIRLFESAATTLRRADYRPSWLYWTARSYERLKQHDTAKLWYLRTIADYRHSYYGREATRALATLPGGGWTNADVATHRDPARALAAGPVPADTALASRLLGAGLWDDAVAELRRLQAGTNTPVIEATIAYALNRKGELRPGITAMRRAYPQFMSDGGEHLPDRLRKVIFPVDHTDLIARYADERGLDRYLVTALMAQESTFQADVVSPANAWGLMQLLPSTGRRYATKLGVTRFSTASLTEPDTNVRLGTAYLADLMTQFDGNIAQALAAYNAGENRVARWRADKPGLPRDEFIDDIPFPETQNYVKRIIGTAEDYRQIYGAPGAGRRGDTR